MTKPKHTAEPWPVFVNLFPEKCTVDQMNLILQTNYKHARKCVNAFKDKNVKAVLDLFELLEERDFDHADDIVRFYNEFVCDTTGKYEALFPKPNRNEVCE